MCVASRRYPHYRRSPMICSRGQDRYSTPWVCDDEPVRRDVDFDRSSSGFEYWSDPNNRDDGFITWQLDDNPTFRMGASAVGPDTGVNGSQVSQRLISEEPMVGYLESWICLCSLLRRRLSSTLVYQVGRTPSKQHCYGLMDCVQVAGSRLTYQRWSFQRRCS